MQASEVSVRGHKFGFNAVGPEGRILNLELSVPGYHNVENMLAALQAALLVDVSPEAIVNGIKNYKGVKRRFEFIAETPKHIYIDDYAHHPTEINAFLGSLKALFPGKKIKVIFQPHLFTRTRDFMEGFAESLSQADEVVLLDIYPAREKPIAGVTSEIILEKITSSKKSLQTKEQVLLNLQSDPDFDVLATIGAGDIDTLVEPIKNILKKL